MLNTGAEKEHTHARSQSIAATAIEYLNSSMTPREGNHAIITGSESIRMGMGFHPEH